MLAGCGDAGTTGRRVVTVAAAASLHAAIADIEVAFETAHPDVDLRATFGSSGNLHAQLETGAPFDIYFAADVGYPHALIESGVAAEADLFVYAVGTLVLWARNESSIDPARGVDALRDPALRKLAIANPEHAPYGRAARDALMALDVWGGLADRLVFGDNVAQAAQFAQTGAADAGIVARSLTVVAPMAEGGRAWDLPTGSYEPIEHGGVIVRAARNRAGAEGLRDFVLSPNGVEILKRHGLR